MLLERNKHRNQLHNIVSDVILPLGVVGRMPFKSRFAATMMRRTHARRRWSGWARYRARPRADTMRLEESA